METPRTPPSGAPTDLGRSSIASTHREASSFLIWGGILILLAHAVELLHAGRANWPALALRAAWLGLLVGYALVLRRPARRSAVVAGTAVAVAGSVVLDLALVAATGGAASPLLWFTPVLAMVLPFMAFDRGWIGVAGSVLLVGGTGLVLLAERAPTAWLLALANGGGGAILCGALLARAFERARRAEELRRDELAEAVASIKTLRGMLPVCSWCHRVRTDAGYWQEIEAYVSQHSDATFTHGLCQDCFEEHFADGAESANGAPARRRSS